jgi:hypothetical protein
LCRPSARQDSPPTVCQSSFSGNRLATRLVVFPFLPYGSWLAHKQSTNYPYGPLQQALAGGGDASWLSEQNQDDEQTIDNVHHGKLLA